MILMYLDAEPVTMKKCEKSPCPYPGACGACGSNTDTAKQHPKETQQYETWNDKKKDVNRVRWCKQSILRTSAGPFEFAFAFTGCHGMRDLFHSGLCVCEKSGWVCRCGMNNLESLREEIGQMLPCEDARSDRCFPCGGGTRAQYLVSAANATQDGGS